MMLQSKQKSWHIAGADGHHAMECAQITVVVSHVF